MSAADKHICYNCFQETAGGGGSCPCCGFDLAENERKYPTALRAGTVLNQRYIAGRVLGQGGFGITYLAWDRNLDTKVAVKEYLPGELADRTEGGKVSVMSADRLDEFTYGAERFKEEAAVLAKFMGQPGIAGVTDRFDENGTSYFVMDYIEGISFKTYIANAGGKISPQEAMDVMIPVLRALTAVHGEGLIHRDVTPDNIYITKDGNVKLLDFGSARYSMGDKSKSLDVILKVGYAPKEQYIRRGRQGPYTDVYSCAACLYAAITGYLPPESLERLDHDTLIPPSEAGAEIPLYLERAILKGLAVQPEDRFQTAEEFLNAIETQQVVELPGEKARSGGKVSREADQACPGRRGFSPLLAGGVGIFAAAALAIGFLSGGKDAVSQGNGTVHEREITMEKEEDEAPAEDAPMVRIGNKEYSTALKKLDLKEQGLEDSDLQALREMTGLEILDLRGNEMSDLSPLSGLSELRELRLSGDIDGNEEIHDLSPLSGLTNLKRLQLPAENIEELSPLSGLTQLENLALIGGEQGWIEDLTPLSGLVNLRELFLEISSVSDLSPLAGMTELESLRVRGESYISDLSPLSVMVKMRELELPASQFREALDISPLSRMTRLESLRMGCNIQDLRPLENLHSLRILQIKDRKSGSGEDCFHSLEPLSGLANLTILELRNDYVTDLSPLSGLIQLESLTLDVPRVTDIGPLSGLSDLRQVEIKGGDIKDWSPVEQIPGVKIR